jgi:hypothetical protein
MDKDSHREDSRSSLVHRGHSRGRRRVDIPDMRLDRQDGSELVVQVALAGTVLAALHGDDKQDKNVVRRQGARLMIPIHAHDRQVQRSSHPLVRIHATAVWLRRYRLQKLHLIQ